MFDVLNRFTNQAPIAVLIAVASLALVLIVARMLQSMTAVDVISGLKMWFMRPYAVGDLVTVAGQHGRVTKVTLTYTALRSESLDKTIIPNSEAVHKIIVNHSQIPYFPVAVTLPVHAGPRSVDAANALLQCAVEFKPRLSRTDLVPIVSVAGITGNMVHYRLKIYVPENARGSDAEGRLRMSAMRALAERGIHVGC